jgi:hypothetical protein
LLAEITAKSGVPLIGSMAVYFVLMIIFSFSGMVFYEKWDFNI